MPKFKFTCEHEHPFKKDTTISTITYESNREYLADVLDDFRDFLKGCGFHIDGNVEVVDNEESFAITSDFDTFCTMNDITQSSFTNDTITIGTV